MRILYLRANFMLLTAQSAPTQFDFASCRLWEGHLCLNIQGQTRSKKQSEIVCFSSVWRHPVFLKISPIIPQISI